MSEVLEAAGRFRPAAPEPEREPYLEGLCRCLHCHAEWIGEAEIGALSLDCPACTLRRGVFVANVMRNDPHWVCRCGGMVFAINARFTYCIACGREQRF